MNREIHEPAFRVGMDVDEAWSQDSAGGVDGPFGVDVEIGAHRHDATVIDCHIAYEPGGAGTVDDPGLAYQQVDRLCMGLGNARSQKQHGADSAEPFPLIHLSDPQ